MDPLEPRRLAETLTRLLQTDGLPTPNDEGWVTIAAMCDAVSAELRREVRVHHVQRACAEAVRLELSDAHLRLAERARPSRRGRAPDVLFHATTREWVTAAAADGVLRPGPRRRVLLSPDEAGAWRAAHRLTSEPGQAGHTPTVLVVDVPRLRRAGVGLQRARGGSLWLAPGLPLRHVLNLRPGFDVQLSAGGLPVRRLPDGALQVALIRVHRRGGATWEVAKGKLEPGETPEVAAIRECQEEMGTAAAFEVAGYVGPVRYGFLAPGGAPRLKTIYLYLLHTTSDLGDARPSSREGISQVAWFTPDDAAEAVQHPSLIPAMRRARDLLLSGQVAIPPAAEPS